MKNEKIHFNAKEKTEIINNYLAFDPDLYSEKIAQIIDGFTFQDLKALSNAIKHISKGKI